MPKTTRSRQQTRAYVYSPIYLREREQKLEYAQEIFNRFSKYPGQWNQEDLEKLDGKQLTDLTRRFKVKNFSNYTKKETKIEKLLELQPSLMENLPARPQATEPEPEYQRMLEPMPQHPPNNGEIPLLAAPALPQMVSNRPASPYFPAAEYPQQQAAAPAHLQMALGGDNPWAMPFTFQQPVNGYGDVPIVPDPPAVQAEPYPPAWDLGIGLDPPVYAGQALAAAQEPIIINNDFAPVEPVPPQQEFQEYANRAAPPGWMLWDSPGQRHPSWELAVGVYDAAWFNEGPQGAGYYYDPQLFQILEPLV